MKVVCTWDPSADERDAVAKRLSDRAVWAVDGARFEPGDGILCFWPKRELAALGVTWADLAGAVWVKVATAGVNHIGWRDVPDVPVMSTPGATADIIAEYNVGAIIAWARGFQGSTADIRNGHFETGAAVRGLREMTIGLVGYGGIARATAAVLTPFGPRIVAINRDGRAPRGAAEAFPLADLPAAAAACDVLVVSLPLRRETEGLIDANVLAAFGGKPALLLNVARGRIVDEPTLYQWLRSDARHHAHLDVWWRYPGKGGHPFTQPFQELPNITMTPHNAPNVTGHRVQMVERAAADIAAILAGGDLTHVEDRADYGMAESGDTR